MIDPTTPLGVLRLRCADVSDLPFLPDSVYTQTLTDNNNSLPRSAIICATYILGMLAFRTHRKLSTLEVWGAEAFANYKEFLLLTVKDPAFMTISPVPYSGSGDALSNIIQFQSDWNKGYYTGTQSQRLAVDAAISPNDGSLYGNFNLTGPQGPSFGWELNGSPP